MRHILSLALCLVFAGSTVGQQWETLFDGKSTEHWRGFKKKTFPNKGWVVEEGCLKVQRRGGGGDIVTKKQYTDFDLRFEWKVAVGANSGIMFRVTEDDHSPWRTGPEYQVLDDAKHRDGKNPKTSAAALYALYAAKGGKVKPVGSFNTGRIVLKGTRLEHWLNARLVVSCDFASAEYKALRAKSKFRSMPNFGRRPRGHIALQDHGDDVWFKNIRIRDLGSKEQKPEKQCSILFIGNSYTYFNQMPFMVKALARRLDPSWTVDVEMSVRGGATLAMHAADTLTRARIADRDWDWVVLQEQSRRPVDEPHLMADPARALHRVITDGHARTLLFMTWARKGVPKMEESLAKTYVKVARDVGAGVAPVGRAWGAALRARPTLPLFHDDGSHPSPAGSYLTACVFLAQLTGQPPKGLPGKLTKNGRTLVDLDDVTAGFLQKIARETVTEQAAKR